VIRYFGSKSGSRVLRTYVPDFVTFRLEDGTGVGLVEVYNLQ
jgi:hypothetical protein